MSSDPVRLDPEAHRRVVDATDGAANVCFQCGTCTATCPWYDLDGETLSVRRMMRSAQLGTEGLSDQLYRCLTCGACEANCPRGVDITEAVLGLRELAFEADEAPGELEGALWSVYEEDNPWERPAGDRDDWLDAVPDDIDVPVGEEAEVLYYVGCAPSYDPALQPVPAAVVQLFEAAGVDYTVLGGEEACCGDVVRQTGEPTFFEDVAERNTSAFEATGAETIVTSSPHCSETFRGAYDLDAEVRHYTEFLRDLVDEGALEFERLDRTVTFHDPCYLARGMAVVDAPRDLLAAAGVTVDEMAASGTDALCCGGGGGHMWQEVEMEERFADRRATQAAETEAGALVTACPFCVQTLDDGVKKTGTDLPVRDLATVLLEALPDDAEVTEP
ncbi:MAG: (Fe-S)-binding protein [Haloarculaceae archaeon]